MKKLSATLRFLYVILLIVLFAGCSDTQPDDVYTLLDQKAKVRTFPLNIVLAEPLQGAEFPEDLKTLCRFASAPCKTLPTAGILRLGPDQYFSYNAIASLNISGWEEQDETSITQSVQSQVASWYIKTKLTSFDSLRSPNKAEFNATGSFDRYVQNTKDSLYFFSARTTSPPVFFAGNRNYPVYRNINELRRIIDEQVCKQSTSISVFYIPANQTTDFAPTGMYAGDTCVEGSKYQKLNDGKGNLFIGKLVEKNSRSCGFTFPTGVAGDTCINFSKYQKLHDGRGGFRTGTLIEKNSASCGYVQPKPQVETEAKLPARPAPAATQTQPVRTNASGTVPATQPVRNNANATPAAAQPVRVNAATPGRPSTTGSPVRVNAPASGVSANATQPLRVNAPNSQTASKQTAPSGNAGNQRNAENQSRREIPTAAPAETKTPVSATSTDRRCARTSEALCEQDERGNYTGRRIQYCYNSAGKIVRTIVIAKCDGDCRCLGE